MTCKVDEVLQGSKSTIVQNLDQLINDLAADFNLDFEPEDLTGAPQLKQLRGEMEIFAVWLANTRGKKGCHQ